MCVCVCVYMPAKKMPRLTEYYLVSYYWIQHCKDIGVFLGVHMYVCLQS